MEWIKQGDMDNKEQLLVGAKILKVEREHPVKDNDGNVVDDDNYIIITTNKGVFDFYASYGSYTGDSLDEYPNWLTVRKREER